jgi:hypothetical protein
MGFWPTSASPRAFSLARLDSSFARASSARRACSFFAASKRFMELSAVQFADDPRDGDLLDPTDPLAMVHVTLNHSDTLSNEHKGPVRTPLRFPLFSKYGPTPTLWGGSGWTVLDTQRSSWV